MCQPPLAPGKNRDLTVDGDTSMSPGVAGVCPGRAGLQAPTRLWAALLPTTNPKAWRSCREGHRGIPLPQEEGLRVARVSTGCAHRAAASRRVWGRGCWVAYSVLGVRGHCRGLLPALAQHACSLHLAVPPPGPLNSPPGLMGWVLLPHFTEMGTEAQAWGLGGGEDPGLAQPRPRPLGAQFMLTHTCACVCRASGLEAPGGPGLTGRQAWAWAAVTTSGDGGKQGGGDGRSIY